MAVVIHAFSNAFKKFTMAGGKNGMANSMNVMSPSSWMASSA